MSIPLARFIYRHKKVPAYYSFGTLDRILRFLFYFTFALDSEEVLTLFVGTFPLPGALDALC